MKTSCPSRPSLASASLAITKNAYGPNLSDMRPYFAPNPSTSLSARLSNRNVPSSKATSNTHSTMGTSLQKKSLSPDRPSGIQAQLKTNFGCSKRRYMVYTGALNTGTRRSTASSDQWDSRRTFTISACTPVSSRIQKTRPTLLPSSP